MGRFEIELDVTATMAEAIKTKNPKLLDEKFKTLKSLIVENIQDFRPSWKFKLPWYYR